MSYPDDHTDTLGERDGHLIALAADLRRVADVERGVLTAAEVALLRDAAALLASVPHLDR